MKDYQQKRMKSFLLPEPVYRQALWAVKDLPRLKEVLEIELEKMGRVPNVIYSSRVCENKGGPIMDFTADGGVNLANISMKIEAIESALYNIPYKYREGLRAKLTEGKDYGDNYHCNTWKKWQQAYIFYVAKNLGLY